jgi:hypothetical protein
LVYYRFEECETGTLVFQNLVSEPAVNSLWTDGVDFYTYIGPPTTLPGTIVTNLTGPIGTGCPTTTTTTSTQAYQTLLLYEQSGGGGWDNSTDACDGTGGVSILVGYIPTGSSVTIGTVIYTDTGLTTPLAGNNNWYQVQGTTDVIQVDASGEIIAIVDCSTTTTTTSTTTSTTTTSTTTTTTAGVSCTEYNVLNEGATSVTFEYEACNSGNLFTFSVGPGANTTVCARTGTLAYVSGDFNYSITNLGSCT